MVSVPTDSSYWKTFIIILLLCTTLRDAYCDTCNSDRKSSSSSNKVTELLIERLLCEYDKLATPADETTLVSVDLNLTRLTMDLKSGLSEMDINMTYVWTDPRLKWDSSLFDTNNVIITQSSIWMPDLEPLNSLRGYTDLEEPFCVLNKTGTVKCIQPLALSVPCGDSVLTWPSDIHTCTLELASLSYSGTDFRLQVRNYTVVLPANLTASDPTLESPVTPLPMARNALPVGWRINKATLRTKTDLYSFNYEWTRIVVEVELAREIASHLTYLLAPFLVLCLLSLSPVLLPANGSSLDARLILGGVAIVGHIMQLQNLAQAVPDSIDWQAPYIVRLHRDAMWVSCILLIASMPGAILLDGYIPGVVGAVEAEGSAGDNSAAPGSASSSARQAQAAKPPPAILMTIAAWLLNRLPPGALLLDNETDVAALVDDQQDDSSVSPSTSLKCSAPSRSWRGLVLLVDRLLFFIFLIVYVILIFVYIR